MDRVLISQNADNQTVVKIRLETIRRPVVGDKFACLDETHQVLTWSKGWIPIAELTTDDYVATLTADGVLFYERPSAIHSYEHEGKMYNLESQQVDLTVTDNHRMYIKKRDRKRIRAGLCAKYFWKES